MHTRADVVVMSRGGNWRRTVFDDDDDDVIYCSVVNSQKQNDEDCEHHKQAPSVLIVMRVCSTSEITEGVRFT